MKKPSKTHTKGETVNKTRIMALVLIVLAMIPLTYVIGRGGRGGHRGGGRGYHHSGRGYRHGGYRGYRYGYGYNPAWWAVPTAVGIAATAAAASSDKDSSYEPDYYPEDETIYEE
jgi:hypothetical protein